ncbi:hypothetical protein C1H46_020123 [Malus baccata]|uniref:Macrophage migration inhibitory factor-like protein n=2 Tax=Maleae TaxID=721813 RepID=A0A5N5H2R7_9ROSA|nr:macrophage migration inhibitory factor homolog [Pyrus x bretschneideri]KAB2621878.1 macrophage migration inhibitory factor-like protein [Pyrus ussuriensis x Pyrus communis]TQD94309.1 hypothetical protein C1H46_020123 [Malus baccata]
MPCLYISTNVNLDGVDTDSIFSEATKAISAITGKPENFVMVVLKGSVPISFGKSTTIPASYGELVAMGGITTTVKRQLIATLGTIFESKLSIPKTRFFLKVVDLSTPTGSKL